MNVLTLTLTLAQDGTGAAGAGAGGESVSMGLWPLFVQSFDLFSIVLIVGSFAAVAMIVRNLMDVRRGVIAPAKSMSRVEELSKSGRWTELGTQVAEDASFVGETLKPVMALWSMDRSVGREALHEAANLGASEAHARWARRVEPLAVIGNLAPLVGLAGTVWGMILAFASLSATGGNASPTELSLGISKALMHTLLGLTLAIPALSFVAVFRARIERATGEAVVVCARVIDRLAAEGNGGAHGNGSKDGAR